MTETSRPEPQKLAAHSLVFWLSAPIAAIIAVVLIAAAWIMQDAATQIRESQAKSEIRLAKTAFALTSNQIVKYIEDYSHWDDSYDYVGETVDLAWTKDNFGPFLNEWYGVTAVFVFDRKGELIYASVPGKAGPVEVVSGSAPELAGIDVSETRRQAVLALERALAGHEEGQQGFVKINGQTVFLAARALRPFAPDRKATEKPKYGMALLKVFDAAELATLSESFGLANLKISDDFKVPLAPINDATPAFGVTWTQSEIGSRFSSDTATALLAMAGLGAVLILLSSLGWYRAFKSVRDAELNALAERAKSVQETARSKSLFVANMSHELRTPLNAIIGFSEMVKEQVLGDINIRKYQEYAADIHSSGKHLLGIVNNILLLSKIEAHQQRVTISDVNLLGATSEALRMVQPDAAKRGIQITLSAGDVPVVRADAQALTQIIINLLSNAVKFSAPGGVVGLELKQSPDRERVQLSVVDTGCGMPQDLLEQLGRPFTQAEDPYRRNHQGTGLGLSICFALARDMGCSLDIKSKEGCGTSATLTMEAAVVSADTAKAA
jgi:two-component system, cell cycle sensor histidine kinase PleC